MAQIIFIDEHLEKKRKNENKVKMAGWPLYWMSFKLFAKKSLAWCKKNWKLFIGAAIPIIILLISRRPGDLSKLLERIDEDYKKELEILEDAHSKEIADREDATKKYIDTLDAIEAELSKRNSELDTKKRKAVEKILKDYEDDPDEITRRIALITGFEIYTD